MFPYFGFLLILGGLATVNASGLTGAALEAYRTAESQAIVQGYIGLAAALALVASGRARLDGGRVVFAEGSGAANGALVAPALG